MQVKLSLFPKFYQNLSIGKLAELVKDAGFDTVNAVIREGFWITPESLKTQLPAYIGDMAKEGINVTFATSGYSAKEIIEDPDPVRIMADNGISEFRIGYFMFERSGVREAMSEAKKQMESVAAICEKIGIKAIYQLHHGTLIANSAAAYQIVNGLPSKHIGIELDPGNQSFDGVEDWYRAAGLLGEYIAASGIKDTAIFRDTRFAGESSKGWIRDWVPIYEGVTDWKLFIDALGKINFSGMFVFMPFYDPSDQAMMTEKLKKEVSYMRKLLEKI